MDSAVVSAGVERTQLPANPLVGTQTIDRERQPTPMPAVNSRSLGAPDARSLLASSRDCIKTLSLDGRLLWINDWGMKLLGIADAGDVMGRSWLEFWEGEDRNAAHHALNEAGRGGAGVVTGCLTVAGEPRWWNVVLSPILDAYGAPELILAVSREITENKRAEDALAKLAREQSALFEFSQRMQSSTSLDDVYEFAQDAILDALKADRASLLVFNDQGVMRFVAWRNLSDVYRAAVEGHSPWTPVERDPEPICIENIFDADLSDDLRATIRREGIVSLAFVPLIADGQLIGKFMVYFNSARTYRADEMKLAMAIGRQVGLAVQRHRAEDALREGEARYRAIVESQVEMICRFRADGQILFANRPYARTQGVTAESLVGENLYDFVEPQDRAIVRRLLDSLSPDSPEVRIGNRFTTNEGMRWILWMNRALSFDPSGRFVEAQASGIDVTDLRNTEEELRASEVRLRELSERLEESVRERTAELMLANEHLQGFTYSVAHDLRQRIRGISANASMLTLDPQALDDENRQTLLRLAGGAKQLGALVDDLLTYARIGKQDAKRESIDLTVLAEEVAAA